MKAAAITCPTVLLGETMRAGGASFVGKIAGFRAEIVIISLVSLEPRRWFSWFCH
jgi:hypothetical protein